MTRKTVYPLLLAILLSAGSMTTGCAPGSGEGAAVGGMAGAILDRHNPWRGGVVGAVLGSIAGATVYDISARGSHEAARSSRPVEYRTEDGRGMYRAEPVPVDTHTKCRKVRERTWEDGRLVKDEVREICRSESVQPGY
ncbi:MAG TPA: hypothetical protein VNX25_01655 [Verrucomicrobiae bacterium]|nr:hypothetical protein [Verrucomicrobiae bacterium]